MNNAKLESERRMGMIPGEGLSEVVRGKITNSEELTPQEKEELRLDIRERYLTKEGRRADVDFMIPLLEANGYMVQVSPDGKRIDRLDWEEKDKDFKQLDELLDKILRIGDETRKRLAGHKMYDGDIAYSNIFTNAYRAFNPDGATVFAKEFRLPLEPIATESYSLLDEKNEFKAPFLTKLNDPNIKTSKAHTEPPAMHVLRVSALIKTRALDAIETMWARILGPTHDMGKEEIADKDTHQLHAEMSAYKLREYLRSRQHEIEKYLPLNGGTDFEGAIEEALLPIRFHHGVELMDRNILTPDELMTLLKTPRNWRIFNALSIADASSVDAYKHLAALNAATVASITEEKIDGNSHTEEEVLSYCAQLVLLGEVVGTSLPAVVIAKINDLHIPEKLEKRGLGQHSVTIALRRVFTPDLVTQPTGGD